MKQLSGSKQKWVLSLALLAVLGTQSYFQVHSNTLDSIELASRTPADAPAPDSKSEPKKETAKMTKPADSKPVDESAKKLEEKEKEIAELKKKIEASEAKAKLDEERLKKVEGTLTAIGCKDGSCETAFASMMKKLTTPVLDVAKADAAQKVEKAEKDEEEMTPAQRKEQKRKDKLAEEKAAKKLEKEEKIAAQKEANEEFEKAMADIRRECKSEKPAVLCVGEKMAELLQEVSERDEDAAKPTDAVVKKAFATYFAQGFEAALKNPNAKLDDINKMLDAVMVNIPAEYSQLKVNAMEAIANVTSSKAAAINKDYEISRIAAQQKDYAKSLAFQNKANEQKANLKTGSNELYRGLESRLGMAEDFDALTYLKENYLVSVGDVLSNLDKASQASISTATTSGVRLNTRGASDILAGGNSTDTFNNAVRNNNAHIIQNGSELAPGMTMGRPSSTRTINRGSSN